MNKVRSLLTKLFLLSIAPFVLLGSGFQLTPFQCEGVRGNLEMFVQNSQKAIPADVKVVYSDNTDIFLGAVLSFMPVQAESFGMYVELKDIEFDKEQYQVQHDASTDTVPNKIAEVFAPSIHNAVLNVLKALEFMCNFHQISLSEQQVLLDIEIGDQVLSDFDIFSLILRAFEEEASNYGFELVK